MTFDQTPRNQVNRISGRGHYDRETIFGILDAGFLCHVGFVVNGQPFVIPTLYGRVDDNIYLHGANASRMLKTLSERVPVCLTVTHVDGLVLARSAFHHSMNYRSAVVFGTAVSVAADEKEQGLFAISENVLRGRWAEVRPPIEKELNATTVLRMIIESASAKVRSGPPNDEEDDYALPIWAGVIPTSLEFGAPQPDERLHAGIPVPQSVANLLASGDTHRNPDRNSK